MAGALGLEFKGDAPDAYTIDIKKSEMPWKSGVHINDLPGLKVEPGTTLQFTVKAFWNKTENSSAFGEITYKFKVIVRDRAEFTLNKTKVSIGDFVVVKCTNISDIGKIKLSAEPDIYYEGYSPKYFKNNDMVYAIIPFSDELQTGKYDLTFEYGASAQMISIELESPQNTNDVYTVKKNDSYIAKLLEKPKSSDVDDIKETLNSINSPEYTFFNSAFIDPTQIGMSVVYSYGSEFKNASGNNSHFLEGIQYSLSNGASVQALNHGIVASIDKCDYLGNCVIVEHGLGLRTIYAHLSDVNVSVGDAVAKGENIGRSGRICEGAQEGVLIMCYVFDTPINYANLYGVSIPSDTVNN